MSTMTTLPTDVIVYFLVTLKEHLGPVGLETLKVARLVSKQWSALAEPILFGQAKVIALIHNLSELKACIDEHVLRRYCQTILVTGKDFESNGSQLVYRLLNDCHKVKVVGNDCSPTFPAFEDMSFAFVTSLCLAARQAPVPLSRMTSILSCFPELQSLELQLHYPVSCNVGVGFDLAKLTKVKIFGAAQTDPDNSRKHILGRLLQPTTLCRLQQLSCGSLEELLRDEDLLPLLRSTINSIGFEARYTEEPMLHDLDLRTLNQFTRLNTLDLSHAQDIRLTLSSILANIPHKVRLINARLSAEELQIGHESEVFVPDDFDDSIPRFIGIQVVDHKTRQPVTSKEQIDAARRACEPVVDALMSCGIALAFIDAKGAMTTTYRPDVHE